ncbi:MAG TPA: sodium:solute symporter family protein [Verrucomicrobiae bacterium]|nr:sodium:solute symporter family protein [Verrucomicrobiae bacterium]
MSVGAFGFHWLDTAVVVAYFIGITAFGLWVARRARTSDAYFRGERKFGWWIMVGQSFGTGTHAEMPVAQAGATFHGGFSCIWYQWKNMLVTPFYWLTAPWYRRSERTTIGEIVEDRYGRTLGLIYSVFAIAYFILNQGVMLQGAGKVISAASGDAVSSNEVVVAMTGAFLLYSFFGGLVASAYTDFVQGLLIIVLSFLLIPLGLREVGGFAGLHAALPPDFFVLYSERSRLDAFTIAMLAINGLVGICAQPHTLTMCATGRSERAGRVGQTYGNMVKRVCTIGWALTGLIAAAMIARRGIALANPEDAFGYACKELLCPGLIGLMVACILAANMSTCSTFMVNTGAIFTRNFFKIYVRPEASDRELLLTGRISGVLLTLLGVLFALTVKSVLHGFLFTETIAAYMGIMVVGGFLWKRANRFGAATAILASFGTYYALNWRATGELMLIYKWQAAPFAWAMLAGTALLVVVSLLTPPESEARIGAFFDKMRRTSDVREGAARPLAGESGQELLLLDLPGWFDAARWRGFLRRHREDVLGFLLAWGVVALTIGLAWAVVRFNP